MPYETPKKYNEPDHYKILGVSPDASENDIKKAFRQASMKWHPDKNSSPEAEPRFKDLGEAYGVLSDQQKRRDYNNIIEGAKENEEQRKKSAQANSQVAQAAAADSPPEPQSKANATANATPPFDYNKVNDNLGSLTQKDGITRELTPTNPQPKWTTPSSSTAIVPADQTALTEVTGKKETYTYTRNDHGQKSTVTLDVYDTGLQQINSGSMADDRAAVELAKQSGWKGIVTTYDLSPERERNLRNLCDEHGLTFEIRPQKGIENKQEPAAGVSSKENATPETSAGNKSSAAADNAPAPAGNAPAITDQTPALTWAAPTPSPQKDKEPEPEYESPRPGM